MKAPRRDRQAARVFGQRSEQLAALLMRAKLFRILARGYRIRDGEIDIVARRGSLVVFVEVKARPTLREAMEAITPRKRQRMSRAARHWIASHPWAAQCALRADSIFIAPRHMPRHVAGVVELDLD
jgi:putative endonuclease